MSILSTELNWIVIAIVLIFSERRKEEVKSTISITPHESVNGYLDRINFYNNSQVARHEKEFTISMEKDLNSIYIYTKSPIRVDSNSPSSNEYNRKYLIEELFQRFVTGRIYTSSGTRATWSKLLTLIPYKCRLLLARLTVVVLSFRVINSVARLILKRIAYN